MKQCTKCGQVLDESMFSKNKYSKDGLYSHCRSCVRKKSKIYNERNKEKHKIYYEKYWLEHKTEKKNYDKQYVKENKEKIKAYQDKYKDIANSRIKKRRRHTF